VCICVCFLLDKIFKKVHVVFKFIKVLFRFFESDKTSF